jgi:hypothetical protein
MRDIDCCACDLNLLTGGSIGDLLNIAQGERQRLSDGVAQLG